MTRPRSGQGSGQRRLPDAGQVAVEGHHHRWAVTLVHDVAAGYDAEVDLDGFAIVRQSDGTHAYDGALAELTALGCAAPHGPGLSRTEYGATTGTYEAARHAVLLWWGEGGGGWSARSLVGAPARLSNQSER